MKYNKQRTELASLSIMKSAPNTSQTLSDRIRSSHRRSTIALAVAFPLVMLGGLSEAAVYLEDFEVTGTTMASAGWTAVQSNGTTQTSSFGVSGSSALAGSKSAFWSSGWAPVWTVSDAPTIADPLADVSWIAQKAATTYRLGIEVGGTWHLSGNLNAASDGATIIVSSFSSGFAAWSGAPADDSTAWDATFTGTLGTPGALPSGTVTRVGLMGLDNLSTRTDNFTINTIIPEPSTALLGGLGLLALLRRRR